MVGARELLRNLAARELKVRYKRSTLGFLWTLLNPLLTMIVFTFVLSAIGPKVEWFPIYFMSGYLPYAFFQASALVACGSIVNNAGLISKVYFPREVLPLSVVAAQLVHLLLAMGLLLLAEIIVRSPLRPALVMLPLALLLLVVFTIGVALLLSAANTFLRDIQEFLNVGFLMLFYLTPVIYRKTDIPARWRWIIELNPLTHILTLFRSALYERRFPSGASIGASVVAAFASLFVGLAVFTRLSARFAKEV